VTQGGGGALLVRPALLAALAEVRDRLVAARFPLETAGASAGRAGGAAVRAQLEDYLLPRLTDLDAPLLAVVGGSTGAGKSTLVNSLVGARVSAAGVLRPTTTAPVLACHPDDRHWFAGQRVLPGLPRAAGGPAAPATRAVPADLRLVASPRIPAGLALLDAPDIDSVVRANRALAEQLLGAADLWLFVTTAARYADAVPWELLRAARERSTALAVILDRIPPGAAPEVTGHLAGMLAEHGLEDAPLFPLAESPLEDGLLPAAALAPLAAWFAGLAADAGRRADLVRRTLAGALDSLGPRVREVAAAQDEQAVADRALRDAVADAYDVAVSEVDEAVRDGVLLRGEVLARWQELVGTGELLRSLEAGVGRLRDRLTAAFTGRPVPAAQLTVALESGVASLIRAAAERAADRAARGWRTEPAGLALLAAGPADLDRASADLDRRAGEAVHGWQDFVLDLVRREGGSRRSAARLMSLGVNGAGLLVMLAVFAHTGGLTGGEVVVAGGTGAVSQKLLEAVFGDQAVRRLAAQARADLARRVDALLAAEAARYTDLLDPLGLDPAAGEALRAAAAAVDAAR